MKSSGRTANCGGHWSSSTRLTQTPSTNTRQQHPQLLGPNTDTGVWLCGRCCTSVTVTVSEGTVAHISFADTLSFLRWLRASTSQSLRGRNLNRHHTTNQRTPHTNQLHTSSLTHSVLGVVCQSVADPPRNDVQVRRETPGRVLGSLD